MKQTIQFIDEVGIGLVVVVAVGGRDDLSSGCFCRVHWSAHWVLAGFTVCHWNQFLSLSHVWEND